MGSPVVYKSPLPRRVVSEGMVACPRKGPTHDLVANERCVTMRERSPGACGACRQFVEATLLVAISRKGDGRSRVDPRWDLQ